MSTKNSLNNIYEDHHKSNRKENFSLLEKERGEFIKEIVKGNKNLDILDIGCRDGNLTKYYNTEINTIDGADIDRNALEKAKKLGINTLFLDLNGDLNELNGKQYDVISAFEIIEHLYFPEKVLKKISKHLKPGGIFIGSVPNAFSLPNRLRILFGNKKGTPLEDPTHINQFHYGEFKQILEKEFINIELSGLVDSKWMWLSKINPNLFSYMLLWKVFKK